MSSGAPQSWASAMVMAVSIGACSDNKESDVDASPVDAAQGDSGPGPDGKQVLGGVRVLETLLDSSGGEAGSTIWIEGPHQQPWPGSLFGVLNSGYLGTDWEVVAREGPCVYIEATEPWFCDPACNWDEYCTADETCATYPEVRDVGTMTLSGLAVPITLEQNDSGRYVSSEQVPPADLFDADDVITLSADGGGGAPFETSVTAVETLSPALACDADLGSGEDLEIQWTPAGGEATVRFEVISWFVHSYSFPKIMCEVGDTGSLTVSASLLAHWAPDRYGLALTRMRRTTAELAAEQEIVFEVASVRSCSPPPM